MTLPFSELQIISIRYIVVSIQFILMFTLSMLFPLSLLQFGNFDIGIIITNCIGVLLNGLACIAISLFISVLFSGSLKSWLISSLTIIFLNGSLINFSFFEFFTFSNHMESFSRGILNWGNILYFIVIIAFCIYFSSKVMYLRRWK